MMGESDLRADVAAIRAVYAKDTSELPHLWDEHHRSVGHCHVVALLLQAKWGGRILRGLVLHEAGITVHYVNFIDGWWVDPTIDQFIDPVVTGSDFTDATDEVINTVTETNWIVFTARFVLERTKGATP